MEDRKIMRKNGGKIGLVLIAIAIVCLVPVSVVNVLSQENHDDSYDSPLFRLMAQRAVDNTVDFSVDYITKEQNEFV